MTNKNFTLIIKDYLEKLGVDYHGIADLLSFRGKLSVFPENLLNSFNFGISLAIRLDNEIIDKIIDSPTPQYAKHYLQVNEQLNYISENLVLYIKKLGFNAINIPASEIIDEKSLRGQVSHKAIARMAGIGWLGKSLLIINPQVGPRLRLATILTDMALIPDKPIINKCGDCKACVLFCPAQAIKNVKTKDYYSKPEEAVDLHKCNEKLFEFSYLDDIKVRVCGVCVKVCPVGRNKSTYSSII